MLLFRSNTGNLEFEAFDYAYRRTAKTKDPQRGARFVNAIQRFAEFGSLIHNHMKTLLGIGFGGKYSEVFVPHVQDGEVCLLVQLASK